MKGKEAIQISIVYVKSLLHRFYYFLPHLFILWFFILNKPAHSQNDSIKYVNLFNPAYEVVLNSGGSSLIHNGTSRVVIPLSFPENTQGWFYRITVTQKDKEEKSYSSLIKDLVNLGITVGDIATGGSITTGIDIIGYLSTPPVAMNCDMFIIQGEENAMNFRNHSGFYHKLLMENIVSTNGYNDKFLDDDVFIGLRNDHKFYGVKVRFEAVAVVKQNNKNE